MRLQYFLPLITLITTTLAAPPYPYTNNTLPSFPTATGYPTGFGFPTSAASTLVFPTASPNIRYDGTEYRIAPIDLDPPQSTVTRLVIPLPATTFALPPLNTTFHHPPPAPIFTSPSRIHLPILHPPA